MCRRLTALILGLILGSAAAGQTFEASSAERAELGADRAFDGKSETRWSAAFKEKTGWIQVGFAERRAATKVTLTSGIRDLKGAPKDLDVLAGDDAEHLTVVASVTGNAKDPLVVEFARREARVWRFVVKARIDERWSPTISEIEFGDGAAAPAAARAEEEVEVTASVAGKPGHEARLALDGDPETSFETARGTKAGEIVVRFKEPRRADHLRIRVRSEGGAGLPRKLELAAKSGNAWKTLVREENTTSAAPVLSFTATTAREWRLGVGSVLNDREGLMIHELEFAEWGDGPIPADPEPVADERRVNEAIDRGARWLEKERGEDGNWKCAHTAEYPMGVMALGGLALKKSGRDRDDPLIQDLVQRLAAMPLVKTYDVGVYAMFLRAVSTKRHVDRLAECARFLADRQAPEGLWGYPDGRPDLSNAQYALLGLAAAADCGVEVPRKVFEKAVDFLLREPNDDGGYDYVPQRKGKDADPTTGSMTAAALAALKLGVDHLPGDRARAEKAAKATEKALAWLDGHFSVELNPGSPQSHYYWLYGLERVGSFYELKKVGGQPWYRAGAAHLLAWQRRDGSWHQSFEDTCFALLFLNRASLTGKD